MANIEGISGRVIAPEAARGVRGCERGQRGQEGRSWVSLALSSFAASAPFIWSRRASPLRQAGRPRTALVLLPVLELVLVLVLY